MLFERNQVIVDSDDVHAIISICAIILLIVAIFSTFGQIFTKIAVVRKLSLDDITAFPALILCGAQTATILVASANGLGKHWDSLTIAQRDVYERSLYASALLWIPTVVITKLSIILFIRGLIPVSSQARIGLFSGSAILAWGVASEFAAAFQCRTPEPWRVESGACVDKPSFWISFNIISVLTDVFLVIWPSMIIYKLHTNLSRRLVTIAYFACRIFVIGATIAVLIFSSQAAATDDPTFDLWQAVICAQAVQALSITAACTLYLRPFFDSLETGLIRSDYLQRGALGGTYSSGPSERKKDMNYRSQKSEQNNWSIPLRPLRDGNNITTVQAEEPYWGEDGQSATSETGIIRYTTTWEVATEPCNREVIAMAY